MDVVSPNASLPSGVNVNLYLCTSFCSEFYSACKFAAYDENSTMIDHFSDAPSFCEAFAPAGSTVFLRDTECLAGSVVAISPYRSFAYGPGVEGGITTNDRSLASFTIQLVDEFGTYLTSGDYSASIGVNIYPAFLNPQTHIIPQQDGTVVVTYSSKRGGIYQISATFNGNAIYGSPYKVFWERPSPCTVTQIESFKVCSLTQERKEGRGEGGGSEGK